jgi:polyisoprenoid-binding protein YceI
LPSLSKPVEFIANDELGRDNISFTSDAPIELIVGRTTNVKGKIKIDDSLDLKKMPIQTSFEVDLVSIDTGIPLRNEHMRDNFLETKKHPKAIFKLKKITSDKEAKLSDGVPVKLSAEGDFTVHGITVKKIIPLKVTYFKESDFTHSRFEHGDVIRVQGTFEIPLKEHKIKRPEVIFQKLADTVIVSVDVFAVSAQK